MKKKLLSLVLAGAMVASTSVSAFADEVKYDIDDKGKDHKVEITGNVTDSENNKVPGTISVTVPTAVSFTINKDGKITGGDIVIKNTSEDKVKVVVKKFTDTDATGGIVLVKDSNLASSVEDDDNSKVHASINIVSGSKSLGLVSSTSDSSTGLVASNGSQIEEVGETALGEAWNDNPLKLSLKGKTKADVSEEGYNPPAQALNNTFNLVFKIQKSTT